MQGEAAVKFYKMARNTQCHGESSPLNVYIFSFLILKGGCTARKGGSIKHSIHDAEPPSIACKFVGIHTFL